MRAESFGRGRSPACADYDGAAAPRAELRRLLLAAEAACAAAPPPTPDSDFKIAEPVAQMPAALSGALYALLRATGKDTPRHHEASVRSIRCVIAAQQLPGTYPTDQSCYDSLSVSSSAFSCWKRRLTSIRGTTPAVAL